jgi:hypothetical protein
MKRTTKLISRSVFLIIIMVLALGIVLNAYAYKSITNRESRVTVDVSPEQLAIGQPIQFQVRMNTHSVELSQDIVAISELRDDLGKIYHPLKWQGSPPEGHHRKGLLEFPVLEGSPTSVKLIIKGVADVSERIFEWEIE